MSDAIWIAIIAGIVPLSVAAFGIYNAAKARQSTVLDARDAAFKAVRDELDKSRREYFDLRDSRVAETAAADSRCKSEIAALEGEIDNLWNYVDIITAAMRRSPPGTWAEVLEQMANEGVVRTRRRTIPK